MTGIFFSLYSKGRIFKKFKIQKKIQKILDNHIKRDYDGINRSQCLGMG
jgi:hypothetical protein